MREQRGLRVREIERLRVNLASEWGRSVSNVTFSSSHFSFSFKKKKNYEERHISRNMGERAVYECVAINGYKQRIVLWL
jgi:hypothetical protein